MSAATWRAVADTFEKVTDVGMDIIVDRAFAPYLIDHEIDIRHVFVDDDQDFRKRLILIEDNKGVQWGEPS